ncbi:MAG: hypothetical protein H6Q42_4746 [Deltaproteobacteria bacterium]|nr:hypothetical protein [Deltaproteobacteria bacterium]
MRFRGFRFSVFFLSAVFFVGGLYPGLAQANPYAKYSGTTLVVNFPSHPYYEYAIKLIPEFTKETGIKVDIDKVEYMRMRDKQLLEMSKPKGDYDLISYVCMWKTEYVAKGLLAPLAPFFTNPAISDPSYDVPDFVPAYLATTGLVGGKKGYLPGPSAALYGVPFGSETSMFAYRKDIFEKHGWKIPQTYDEMLKLCRLVREKEPNMYGLTSRGEAGHQVAAAWLFHLSPYAGEVFDDNWEPAFQKEPSLKALRALIEIVKTGPPGIPTFAYGSMNDAFLLGNAAMYLDNTALPGIARDPARSKVVGKVGYGLHPRAVKHSQEGSCFSVPPVADHESRGSENRPFGGHAQPPLHAEGPGASKRIPRIQGCPGKHQICQPRLAPLDSGMAGDFHDLSGNGHSRSYHRKENTGGGHEWNRRACPQDHGKSGLL